MQVRSKASQSVLDDYIGRFRSNGAYDRMFFVCHTTKSSLSVDDDASVHLWASDRLAVAAVKAGLVDWLIERSV